MTEKTIPLKKRPQAFDDNTIRLRLANLSVQEHFTKEAIAENRREKKRLIKLLISHGGGEFNDPPS